MRTGRKFHVRPAHTHREVCRPELRNGVETDPKDKASDPTEDLRVSKRPNPAGSHRIRGMNGSSRLSPPEISPPAEALIQKVVLCVQRQAAAVCVLLRFLRLGVLALEVGESHVEGFARVQDLQALIPDHLGLTSGVADDSGSGSTKDYKGVLIQHEPETVISITSWPFGLREDPR